MTRDEIVALLDRHQEAFARRDADALAAQHAEDGAFESPAHGVVHGRAKIADIYRYWFTAFPDLQLHLGPPIVGDDRVAVFWRFAGTAHGPFFGIAGAGTRIEMSGAAEYVLADGAIQSRLGHEWRMS